MKTTTSRLLSLTRPAALLLLGTLVLACSGSNGSNGAPGAAGPAGPPGPTSTSLTKFETAPGVDITITGLSGASGGTYFEPGDTITVQYTLLKDDGEAWDVSEMGTTSIFVSGPTFNYQRVITTQSNLKTASKYLGNGQWSYTFTMPIPAVYQPPYNDPDPNVNVEGELTGDPLLDGTYTVGMYMGWNYSVDGQPGFRDVGNAHYDFLVGSTAVLQPREVVAQANCNECHVQLQAHGGLRQQVVLCEMCHTAGAEDRVTNPPTTPDVTIEFKVMIHKIHNGAHLPSVLGVATNPDGSRDYSAAMVPYEIVGFGDTVHDFSEVEFPVWPNLSSPMPKNYGYSNLSSTDKGTDDGIRGGVTACFKCHGDPDGDGPITAVPAQGDLYKTEPSMNACGSCHDDVNWHYPYTKNQQTMPVVGATACNLCHPASGSALAVENAHVHPLNDPTTNPGVGVDITDISGGTGASGRFLAGDTPTIEFTLKDDEGDDVGLPSMDSSSSMLAGPTNRRQAVFPLPSPNGVSVSPYDFSGRLAASSTSNKGSMSKVVPTGTPVAETLTVEFSSATAFAVTGSDSGPLGGGTLPGSPSTNPSGSSLSAVSLTSAAVAQQITVAFSGPTAFSVTGSVSGAMGAGTLPNTVDGKSCSNRFTSNDGTVSFTVTAGTTAFSPGQNIYLTVFKGSAANPVLFAIVAGRTSFSGTLPAPDRFYYEVVPAAASYTLTLPMDLVTEYIGNVSGSTSLQAGNPPVYFGRQTVWEVTSVTNTTTLAAAAEAQSHVALVSSTAGFAVNDIAVVEPAAGIGTREYLQIGQIDVDADTTLPRLWFKTPLRYAHSSGMTLGKAALSFRQEGSANQYSLNRSSGTVTPNTGFTNGNAVVISYRTDGRFGWYRHDGDALQAVFQPPPNDSPEFGREWGKWKGLAYLDGTYTASIWLYQNDDVPLHGETQTYRSASVAALKDFLYGAGSTAIEPENIVVPDETCNSCHMTPLFHGLGRAGLQACLMCHGILAAEDTPQYSSASAPATPDVTIQFRTMLHKIHMGSELTFASTYEVAGFGGASSTYEDVEFPAMPQGTKHCDKCHGSADAWKLPNDESYPGDPIKTRAWRAACNSCHDSNEATAHINLQTKLDGSESCEVCHGEDADFSVEVMHTPRTGG